MSAQGLSFADVTSPADASAAALVKAFHLLAASAGVAAALPPRPKAASLPIPTLLAAVECKAEAVDPGEKDADSDDNGEAELESDDWIEAEGLW